MATLTADELADIRLVVGDGCEKYSNDQIQAWYDAAGSDLPTTYVTILQRMWSAAKAATLTLNSGIQTLSRAQVDVLKERLDYWERKAGISGGTITVGTLNLGIDYTEEDFEAGL